MLQEKNLCGNRELGDTPYAIQKKLGSLAQEKINALLCYKSKEKPW